MNIYSRPVQYNNTMKKTNSAKPVAFSAKNLNVLPSLFDQKVLDEAAHIINNDHTIYTISRYSKSAANVVAFFKKPAAVMEAQLNKISDKL